MPQPKKKNVCISQKIFYQVQSSLNLFLPMPTESESHSSSPQAEAISFSTTFAISLTVQKVTPPKPGSKAASKVSKDTKTKETQFAVDKDNYVGFLKLLLAKHGESKYRVTKQNVFSFKYICPPARKYVFEIFIVMPSILIVDVMSLFSKSDSIDVDDESK